MLSIVKNIDAQNVLFISLSGKLWTSTCYDFEIDDYLNDGEKLFVPYTTSQIIYENSINGVHVTLKNISFVKPLERKKAVDALRNIARILAEKFPEADKIELSAYNIYLKQGKIESDAKKYMKTMQGPPEWIFINKNAYSKYFETIKSLTTKKAIAKEELPWYSVLVLPEYFIVIERSSVVVFSASEVLKQDDPLFYLVQGTLIDQGIKGEIVNNCTPKTIIKKGVKAYTDNKSLVLASPPKTPENAFIINFEPTFIQFTRSGIAITEGAFFIDEPLEEVRKPWYIVEKTPEGWEIYFTTENSYTGGYYKVIGHTLVYMPYEKTNVPKNALYIDYYSIMFNNGKLVIPDYDSIPVQDIFSRVKLAFDGKTIYVPKLIVMQAFKKYIDD